MPAGEIIQGIASLAGVGAGLYQNKQNQRFQQRTNEQEMDFQREMYARSRQDSLTDWASQNAYNSPEEQMNRLRQAGLNPHLVYGKGADNTASVISQGKTSSANLSAPRSEIMPALEMGANALMQFQQIKNVKQQTENLEANRALTMANTANAITKGAHDRFDFRLAQDLRKTTVDFAKENLRKLQVQSSLGEIKTYEASQIQLHNIAAAKLRNAKTAEEIQLAKNMNRNLQIKNTMGELDVHLKKMGLQPSDPIYWRVIQQFLQLSPEQIKALVDF